MCYIEKRSLEPLEHLYPNFPIEVKEICSLIRCQILIRDLHSPRVYFVNNIPYIIISNELPSEIFREKIAHELGHILLEHHNEPNKKYELKESEANRFALFLLIPTHELKKQLKYLKTVYELANFFGVTYEFMIKRLDLCNKKYL